MKTKATFQELMAAFDVWCAAHTLSASAKAFMRTVLVVDMAKANAWRDAERAEHAKTFEQVLRVRAQQIIGHGC